MQSRIRDAGNEQCTHTKKCIQKHLYYLSNFFYHKHEDFFVLFFKNWAALKSRILQVLSYLWLPKIISPYSHNLHHCSSKT